MRQQTIEYVDFAKGYAIFTIVCYHALQKASLTPMLQKAIVFGGTGVHLFFLLSGFGLALSKNTGSPLAFYRRRLTKIWLPYVLALTISWLAAYWFDLFPDRWAAWLAGVALYQMFVEPYILSFGGHFWFISAILQLYLLFPVLLWLKKRLAHNGWFLALAMFLSMAWWLVVFYLDKGQWRTWNSFFLQFLWEFALGMVLADSVAKDRQETNHPAFTTYLPFYDRFSPDFRRLGLLLLVGLGFTGLMGAMIVAWGEVGKIFNDIPALIGYSALSICLYGLGLRVWPPLKQFFLWVGSFSYSLYLTHVLVLDLYLLCLKNTGHSKVTTLWLLPFLLLALLGGRLFEPLSQWWTKRWSDIIAPRSHPRQ